MTSDPSPPPQNIPLQPLRPRHRQNLGNLAKDTTETELWAFDEPESSVEATTKRVSQSIPTLRSSNEEATSPILEIHTSGRHWPTGNFRKPTFLQEDPIGNFSDLESAEMMSNSDESRSDHQRDETARELSKNSSGLETLSPATPSAIENFRDEFSATQTKAKPNMPRTRANISTIEWIGLTILGVLLIAAAALIFQKSIGQLPTKSAFPEIQIFPVKGEHLSITSAITYWREPETKEGIKEVVRAGTTLLPVLELTSASAGEIRASFRDENGKIVGDVITRTIQAGTKTQIACTAGFSNSGMHAAYRAHQTEPWTIEIDEAAAGKSSHLDFKKLVKLSISTESR